MCITAYCLALQCKMDGGKTFRENAEADFSHFAVMYSYLYPRKHVDWSAENVLAYPDIHVTNLYLSCFF